MALTPEQEALNFNPELQDVSRERKLAELLMAKGVQGQPQGQMISGYYVAPSFAQQLNPLANMLAGQAVGERADTKQTELATALRTQGNAAAQDVLETFKTDKNLALQKAVKYQQFPQVQALVSQLTKVSMPEATTEERIYDRAVSQGYKGTINDFKNQMTEDQKESNRIARARLNLSAQEQAFNTGMPMGGVSAPQGSAQVAPQAPLRTINPGSPILAPGQQAMPQSQNPQTMTQGQTPIFKNKAEQDIYVATQKEAGKLKAEAVNALPGALQTVQSGLEAINGMIGDTTVDKNGKVVYGKIEPHPGFNGAVGISGIGSGFGAAGFIPGTDVKDFQARFKQVEGQAFLGAINTLRGTGAISEIEGAKATAALNRMSLSQSEAEFVKAANDFKEILQKGYNAAQQRAGVTPFNSAAPNVNNTNIPTYDAQTGTWK